MGKFLAQIRRNLRDFYTISKWKKKRNSLRNRYHAYHMLHIKKIRRIFWQILFSIKRMIFCPAMESSYFISFWLNWVSNLLDIDFLHTDYIAAVVEVESFWQLKKSETSWKPVVTFSDSIAHIRKRLTGESQVIDFECLN